MKKRIAILLLCLAPAVTLAAGSSVKLEDANVDLDDKASLQRGARLFVNYCLSCHSAQFMRYNRMGEDLGLSEEQVRENLMFASDKVGSTMTVAMPADESTDWFGVPPPDLSVVARSRGPDWLYTYLISFYRDDNPARPFGVNNLVFQDVAMPHVMWELQGIQKPVYKEVVGQDGEPHRVIEKLELAEAGTMEPGEFRRAMSDLVNFLTYMGEPAKLVRYEIGAWVLAFMVVFFFISYALYKEYWKDVH